MSNKWILSATEIDTFATCKRKWAYRYLDRIDPPPSKAAQFGSAVHKVLEKYLIKNQINYETAEGRVASPGLAYLPKKLSKQNVERQIFFSVGEHLFQGYIDFFEQVGPKTWLIGDHKTCSSFNYALSPDDLKQNIQANVYAQWAFKELSAKTVKLKWIYYRTKGAPQARVVESEIKSEEATSLFEHPSQVASNIMATLKGKPNSSDLPKNLDACFKYGPCPFFAKCKSETAAANTRRFNRTAVAEVLSNKREVSQSPMIDASKKSFHLFIDCVPTKSESSYERTIELSELLKPVLTKIQTEKELSHYRLAGYGQHVGLIANYLSEYLRVNAYDDRTAVLSSLKTPEGCDTLQTLTAAASQVVRGF